MKEGTIGFQTIYHDCAGRSTHTHTRKTRERKKKKNKLSALEHQYALVCLWEMSGEREQTDSKNKMKCKRNAIQTWEIIKKTIHKQIFHHISSFLSEQPLTFCIRSDCTQSISEMRAKRLLDCVYTRVRQHCANMHTTSTTLFAVWL